MRCSPAYRRILSSSRAIWTGTDDFNRFAGLKLARAALWKARRDGSPPPALLILGMLPEPSAPPKGVLDSTAVLAWPGARYIQFGSNKEELRSAALAAVKGRRAPLPEGVWPSTCDIRRVLATVRHWLEGRLRTSEGAGLRFDLALGAAPLHRRHLEPIPAMSPEHRDILEGLWAMESPGVDEFFPLRRAIGAFEDRWEALEACRAQLRGAGDAQSQALLESTRDAQHASSEALSEAIEAARSLERGFAGRDG